MTGQERLGVTALALLAAGMALIAATPQQTSQPMLQPVSFTLPDDEAIALPAGLHTELFLQRCTACHSAGMITRQPALKPDQWAAIVKKMRETYKAPISDAEVPPILDQLAAISAAHLSGS